MLQNRITKELTRIQKSPPQGIHVSQKDKITEFEISILGPENSAYKGGVFNLEMNLPESYPFSPPSIKFITKIYHPNIDDNGRICLDLLKMPPKGSWRPTIGIEGLLVAVRMLLETPNPEDPLMVEIAEVYMNNRTEFERKVEEYVKKYAMGGNEI